MIDGPRILIVSEHASARFGGEAALPLHYFRVLRKRGFPVWLVTHERTRAELSKLFPDEQRILYVEDTRLHRLMWHASRMLPARIAYFTVGFVSRFAAQLRQRQLVRKLIAEEGIEIVHQPMPVSPREPSMMYGFDVPVIIGPMNGGMDYPPAFQRHRGVVERGLLRLGRLSSILLNRLIPGKRVAALLLVANSRTRAALPGGTCPRVVQIVENGVDLSLWQSPAPSESEKSADRPPTFVFVGRLVDWKAVDLLLHAFKRAASREPMHLLIIGDGAESDRLKSLAQLLGIRAEIPGQSGTVFFAGWLDQDRCAEELRHIDCLVLPSLLECGGAVVLEAMSMSKPVIATDWGGPADYISNRSGLLVPPTTKDALIQGLEDAMVRLAASPSVRKQMGENGRREIELNYDWEIKIDRILELYRDVLAKNFNATEADVHRVRHHGRRSVDQ